MLGGALITISCPIAPNYCTNCQLLKAFKVGENRDGQHGTNATRAIPGSRAGFIAVELSESTEIPEGVHVQVMQFHSREEPPASVEVPAQRDVLFTAIGGLGEPGHQGGNGQAGMDGVDGEPATRESDARVSFSWTNLVLSGTHDSKADRSIGGNRCGQWRRVCVSSIRSIDDY